MSTHYLDPIFPVLFLKSNDATCALTWRVKTRRHRLFGFMTEHLRGWDPPAEEATMGRHFNQWKRLNTGGFYS